MATETVSQIFLTVCWLPFSIELVIVSNVFPVSLSSLLADPDPGITLAMAEFLATLGTIVNRNRR